MIRLTVHALSEPQIHLFNKSIITIGSESSQADLTLSEDGLQPIYLNIIEQNNFPIIINLANDPFISLNGHPFGKKLLNNGDVILVHDTEILFEIINAPREEEKTPEVATTLLDMDLPFEKEVEALKDEEWHPSAFDQLLAEITTSASSPRPVKTKAPHLKDDYLKDLDDDNQSRSSKVQAPVFQTRKWVLFFLSSLLTIAAIVGVVVYINALNKTEEEEIIAAREVADISMALTRAQLLHLKPNNHNWSDSEFLSNNLNAILTTPSAFDPETNQQSPFATCPYNLRIYTSWDLSRFLLIAQPEPSFLQWLIPKSVIIVDSMSMELRGIKDLRSINRLLANAHPLEGPNGKEISRILLEGTSIPLERLAHGYEGADFVPPPELAALQPGAEKLIYNAPRYCLLAQTMIDKAVNLVKTPGKTADITALKLEAETFSRLPSYVVYSKDGKKGAWLAQQGIATFAPLTKFIYGYVAMDEIGQIVQGNIIELSKENFEPFQIAQADETSVATAALASAKPNVDTDNPIYLYLSSLAAAREKELRLFATNINTLLNQQNHTPLDNFPDRLSEALSKYNEVDKMHLEQIKQTIKSIYKQQVHMSLNDFLVYVKAAGFESLVHSSGTGGNLQEEWSTLTAQIDNITSFSAMYEHVQKTINKYDIDDLIDFKELQRYQNEFRNKVLDWLEKQLLSAHEHFPNSRLTQQEQESFKALVNLEKVFHANERDYFLKEFVLIAQNEDSTRFQLQAMDDIIKSLNNPKSIMFQ